MSPRKSALTREEILDAALAILDREGIEGLSMRKVGAAVGVEAMSLYNHVDDKAALLDGIHERILTSLDPPSNARTWQALIKQQAKALHRALCEHPNAISLFATRPASTPRAVERLGQYLERLVDAGFDPGVALSIIQLVAQLVVGHTLWSGAVEIVDWSHDKELQMGIDALIAGFERLL